MKNTIIVASAIVVVVGLLIWGNTRTPRSAAAIATGSTQAALGDPIPEYDFGPISMIKGNVEHEFAITNTTGADLKITRAETSCMCTKAVLRLPDGKEMGPFSMPGHGFNPSVNVLVRPDETFIVQAIFDPAAHGPSGIGNIERAVLLTTDKGSIAVPFKAHVTP